MAGKAKGHDGRVLLNVLFRQVVPDEVLEDGKHVLPIADDALQQRAQLRIPPRFPIPFGQHRRRNLDSALREIQNVTALQHGAIVGGVK